MRRAPTLEPALTTGNEAAVSQALAAMRIAVPLSITADAADQIFQNAGKRKGEFALLLGAELSWRLDTDDPVAVPAHFREMLEYLYPGPGTSDAGPPPADA